MLKGGGRGVAVQPGGDGEAARPRDGHFAGRSAWDFRRELYRRYVSAFKQHTRLNGEPSVAWWDHKYLPLFQGLEPTAPILEVGCGAGELLADLGLHRSVLLRNGTSPDSATRQARRGAVERHQSRRQHGPHHRNGQAPGHLDGELHLPRTEAARCVAHVPPDAPTIAWT